MNHEIRTWTERKWKKDRLQVSFYILREALANFQSIVKVAKDKYFSNIMNKNSNKPTVLFNTINKVIFPAPTNCLEPSQKM